MVTLSRDLQSRLDEKQSPLTFNEIDNCVQAHPTPPMAGISDSSVSFYYGPFARHEMTIQISARHVQLVPTAEIQAARAGPTTK